MTIQERDALNNVGLPQLTSKNELTKNDVRTIKNKIEELDKYYIDDSFKESNTRKTLKTMVNNYCDIYRCSSLLIK